MKQFFQTLLIVSFACFSLGCSSKDDPIPDEEGKYYFRFKVDGTAVDYPYRTGVEHNLVGHINVRNAGEGPYVANIGGIRILAENNKNVISFFMQTPEEVVPNKKYGNVEVSGSTVPESFNLGYFDPNGVIYSAAKMGSYILGDAVIQFTEITANNAKGTFSGTLGSTGPGGGTVEITEGEFNVISFYQP